MNKKDLIDAIADGSGINKSQADTALNVFVESVSNALAGGNDVALPGFGSFVVKDRAARQGRNPRTGETINIAASKAPGFKASSVLKKKLNS